MGGVYIVFDNCIILRLAFKKLWIGLGVKKNQTNELITVKLSCGFRPLLKKNQPNHFLLLSLSQKNQSVALRDAINEMFRHICGALGDDKFTYFAFHQIATKKLGRSFGACPTAMHVCFATLSWLFGVPLPCSLPGGGVV